MSDTTFDKCNCSIFAAGAPLTPRFARSKRVLHHNTLGGVVILMDSKIPRNWRVLIVRGASSLWRIASFSSTSIRAYHEAQPGRGVKESLREPEPSLVSGEFLALALHQSIVSGTDERATEEIPDEEPPAFEGYTPRAKKVKVSDDTFHSPAPNPDLYWYESAKDAKSLKDFVSLRLAGHTTNLMIVGPSGFGKTRGIIRYGQREGVPVHVVNCQAITTPEKWIGQMQVSPERGTFFEKANHVEWVERTHDDCKAAPYCIILYDEITRLRADLANMQFSLLDDQQGLEVPQMGRRIVMSPQNVVIATANIGAPYTGAFTMDWALRGRFDYNIERPFPPAEEEAKVLTTATIPGISQQDAESIVRVAEHTRKLWVNGELESPISTRSLVAWARLIAGGYTVKDASEYTINPLYSEDGGVESDRAKVKQAIDGKVSS